MIIANDAANTLEFDDHFIIHPTTDTWMQLRTEILASGKAKSVESQFNYNSGTNEKWLSVNELKSLIEEHVKGISGSGA